MANNKRRHSTDSDIESLSEEGTSGSEYEPVDTDSDVEIISSSIKRPPKRKTTDTNNTSANNGGTSSDSKRVCSYKNHCYRKNPDHFREFSHPHLETIMREYKGSGEFPIPQNLAFQKKIVTEQLKIFKQYSIYPCGTSSDPIQGTSAQIIPKMNNAITHGDNGQSTTSAETPTSQPLKKTDTHGDNGQSTTSAKTPTSQPLKKTDDKRKIEDFFNVVAPKGKMAEKHDKAAPYYLFFTTITSSKITHNQPLSITFQELLDPSLGTLSSSLQINFMVDLGWLLAQYYFAGYNNKPLTILYGEDSPDLKEIGAKKQNVQAHHVPMQNAFGKHHTKMSILCYDDDSIRIVISTANLYIDDWENRTQGLWLSPKCPQLANEFDIAGGDSPTGFKRSLINYLNTYNMACLVPFIDKVKHADFSAINVFFIGSVPGGHFDYQWGLSRIGSLLSKHCVVPLNEFDKWEFIAQASSIGSYGADPKLWLTGDFQHNFCLCANKSMLTTKKPALRLIYPSFNNVKASHDDLLGGGCLPYSMTAHSKQTWLKSFLHQWTAEHSGRNRAMPHIKSYLRMSPDATKAAFFLLTSGNISKSAWGVFNKGNRALRINSYEVGVLFLPKFIISADHFSLITSDPERVPIPYDLPPKAYESNDEPWVMDCLNV